MEFPQRTVTAVAPPPPQWLQDARQQIWNQNMGQPIPYKESDLNSPPWAVQARRSIFSQNLGLPTPEAPNDLGLPAGQTEAVTIAHPVTGNQIQTTPDVARQLIQAGHAVAVPVAK
jgi:hypothetical protein